MKEIQKGTLQENLNTPLWCHFWTLGSSLADGHAIFKRKRNVYYLIKLNKTSIVHKTYDLKSHNVLHFTFWKCMHQTQTVSLYFFNDPRNYMLVKLDTIKTRPIEHQRTTLLKQPLCCLADKSLAPVVHSLQSHERKFRMFKRLFI